MKIFKYKNKLKQFNFNFLCTKSLLLIIIVVFKKKEMVTVRIKSPWTPVLPTLFSYTPTPFWNMYAQSSPQSSCPWMVEGLFGHTGNVFFDRRHF